MTTEPLHDTPETRPAGAMTLLCPGQGAQLVGMGKLWAEASPPARAVFDEADTILASRLGAPLSQLCFEGPAQRLNQTDVSQPAIYVTSVACWRGLIARWGGGIMSEDDFSLGIAAGLSLGEYTALHIAGAFSFADGLELVTLRGRAMQDAAEAEPSGMLALIGADEAKASEIADRARGHDVLVCANFNAPGQVVLSGHLAAIDRAASVAQEMGIRAAALPVAGAFHSPLMAPAAERLRAALDRTDIRPPQAFRCPVVSNVTARPHGQPATVAEPRTSQTDRMVGQGAGAAAQDADGGSVRRLLVEQLTSPVRWAESCRWLLDQVPAPGGIHEVAPGATLAGLMRRIDRSVKVTSHDQP